MDSRSQDMDWLKQDSHHENAKYGDKASAQSDAGAFVESALGDDERAGAVAEDVSQDLSIEALQAALEQMTVPPCPDDLRAMLEETSLEKLVYWKLQALFERFEEAPPENVLRIVHEHVERPLFSLVLKKTKGNQSRAAHVLGCNRNTLHRKLKSLAIQPREVRRALKLQRKRSFRTEIENLLDGN